MFASATASPFRSPADTPYAGSIGGSPSHSRSHSPDSISLQLGSSPAGATPVEGGAAGRTSLSAQPGWERRESSSVPSLSLYNGRAINYEPVAAAKQGAGSFQNESGIMFHEGLSSIRSLSLVDSECSSRSESPGPFLGAAGSYGQGLGLGFGLGLSIPGSLDESSSSDGGAGAQVVEYGSEELQSFAETLASALASVLRPEVKKKDSSGRTFQSCFTGKEALNCLRQKLPRAITAGATGAAQCQSILQQLLDEGLIVEAQSIEELNKQIAAKFAVQPTGGAVSKPASNNGSSNSLAFKVPTNIGGAMGAATPPFRKEGMYQLSSALNLSRGASVPSSAVGSAAQSRAPSPSPLSLGGGSQWYTNYSGWLGKKRENKGLGNSLALGLGVSTFQRRWFALSHAEQAVLYFKDAPNDSSASAPQMPLGFIPFSEILFVDHLQSSANQMAAQQAAAASMTSFSNKGKKGSLSRSGTSTPPLVPSSTPAPVSDDKAGRLFDIVASFRVYHLQADSSLEAMKWTAAIKESVAEYYRARNERSNTAATAVGMGGVASSRPASIQATQIRTPRTPEVNKRFWSNRSRTNLHDGSTAQSAPAQPHAGRQSVGGSSSSSSENSKRVSISGGPGAASSAASSLAQASAQQSISQHSMYPTQLLSQLLRHDPSGAGLNGMYGRQAHPAPLSSLRQAFFQLQHAISSLDQPCHLDLLMSDFPSDAHLVSFLFRTLMQGFDATESDPSAPRAFRPQSSLSHDGAPLVSAVSHPIVVPSVARSARRRSIVDASASGALLASWRSPPLRISSPELMEQPLEEEEQQQSGLASRPHTPRFGPTNTDGEPIQRTNRHRRAISCGVLPDDLAIGRPLARLRQRERAKLAEIDFVSDYSDDDDFAPVAVPGAGPVPASVAKAAAAVGFASPLLQLQSARMRRGRSHRRTRSDPWPVSRALLPKLAGWEASLRDRYVLAHSSAAKVGSSANDAAGNDELLNPSFLYRLLHPYRRLESWLRSDHFLTLLLNDSSVINEVPLALPLVWLILQWRNHDSEDVPDDACLKRNWLDASVDAEEDGFHAMGADSQEEADAIALAAAREAAAKQAASNKRSLRRAHLRVNSFSTMADPLSAIRSPGPNAQQQSAAASGPASGPLSPSALQPLSPGASPMSASASFAGGASPSASSASPSAPVVYGSNGVILTGGPQHSPHMPDGSPRTPQSPVIHSSPNAREHGMQMPRMHPSPHATRLAQSLTAPSSPSLSPAPTLQRQWSGGSASPYHTPPRRSIERDEQMQSSERLTVAAPDRERDYSCSEGEPGAGSSPLPHSFTPGAAPGPLMQSIMSGSSSLPPPVPGFSLSGGSSSGPPTRRNSLTASNGGKRYNAMDAPSVSFAPAASASATLNPASSPQRSSGSKTEAPNSPVPSQFVTPSFVRAQSASSAPSSPVVTPLQAMALLREKQAAMKQRERGTIYQTRGSRPPNLLSAAAGASAAAGSSTPGAGSPSPAYQYQTIRSPMSGVQQAGGHGTPAAAVAPPVIPDAISHWKVRSLVKCAHCRQTALEFCQAVSERYGADAGRDEAQRYAKSLLNSGRKPRPVRVEQKLTISVCNSLFSLLLTPLYTLPSLAEFAPGAAGASLYAGDATHPVLRDSFNVLGRLIVSPHVWPTLLRVLRSTRARVRAETLPLKHHVLKDLTSLFVGGNQGVNQRNCRLLLSFFAQQSRMERRMDEEAAAEKEKEKRMNDKERERAERRRRKRAANPSPRFGAWQSALLAVLAQHVPKATPPPVGSDPGVERLHSKVYQYALNLFGVFHFYKFQCIGSVPPAPTSLSAALATPKGSPSSSRAGSRRGSADGSVAASTGLVEFESMFLESFWRSMALHSDSYRTLRRMQRALAETNETGASSDPAAAASQRARSLRRIQRTAAELTRQEQTVARSMITTMMQRLIFKIKSKTCTMEQRWPAVAFLIRLVRSFVFSTPLRSSSSGNSSPPPGSSGSSTSSETQSLLDALSALDGLERDFLPHAECLHADQLASDAELLEKSLELLRALRLYQELDSDSISLAKQREIKAHVEKESHGNKGRMLDINDPSSKLPLNSAHEDLCSVFSSLSPSDASAFRTCQGSVALLKDSICFLALMARYARAGKDATAASKDGTKLESQRERELVQAFLKVERREKVFCPK